MPKEFENRRLDSIPLPNPIVEALSPVEKQRCVSHSVKLEGDDGHEKRESIASPELTSNNHAFYVGKLIPKTTSEKIRSLLGWNTPHERIYNEEFLTGALEYLFDNLGEGQKARVVVCRSLSELLNGPEDVEHALTTDKEIALIKRIAKKKFKKTEDCLEVVDLEAQPQHKDLFEALHNSVDPETGGVDIEKALAENEDGESVVAESTSLQIAKILFAAAKSSEELDEAFKRAMPGKIKDSADENSAAQYYSLVEVAIRLGDILNGMHIQGGSERQAVYNGIIIQLVKGEEGKYIDIEELKPLFPMLKGLRFETLHLHNEENYYHLKKVQNLARYRMLIFITLLLSIALGGAGIGQWHERRQQKRRQDDVDGVIRQSLKDTTFYVDKFTIGKEHNVNIFHEMTKRILNDLQLRYQLSEDACEELKPFIQKYLLDNQILLSYVYRNNSMRIDMADLFVRKHAIYFKNKGADIGRPYQHLHKYIPIFRALLESDENLSFGDGSIDPVHPVGKKNVKYVGTFVSGESYNEKYEFYLHKDGDKNYLVARDRYKEEYGSNDKYFTSKRAREGVREFFKMIARYDALSLDEFSSQIHRMTYWSKDDKDRLFCEKRSIKNPIGSLGSFSPYAPAIYKDFFSKFEYLVIEERDYDTKRETPVDCLLARTPQDKAFTYSRMMEVVKRYRKAKGQE